MLTLPYDNVPSAPDRMLLITGDQSVRCVGRGDIVDVITSTQVVGRGYTDYITSNH